MRWAIALVTMLLVATPATARWRVAHSAHFTLYSEADPATLRADAETLERFDAAMRLAAGPRATRRGIAPVTIFALSDREIRDWSGWSNVEGLYSATAAGAYAFTMRAPRNGGFDAGRNVLLHEYAHHFMLNHFPANYPDWFVEGFAEFMASARFNTDGSVDLGVPSNDRGAELKMLDQLPLTDMVSQHYGNVAVLEAKGWLLTHFLTFEAERKGQLAAFLTAINQGEGPAQAAARLFGDLRFLDKELDAYARRRSLPFLRLMPANLPIVPVTIADASAAEAALMKIRVTATFDLKPALIKQQVIAARRLAAPFGDDPAAQCMLAQAEDRAGRPSRTEAAAERALRRDPTSVCAMIYKGRARLALAELAGLPADNPAWGDARGWFVRANRMADQDPWPMALYYQSFLAAHAPPTPNAIAALMEALARAPQDRQLRYMATIELLRAGRTDDARIAFAPLASEERVARYRSGPAHDLLGRIGHADPAALADEFEAQAGRMGVLLPG